MAAKKRSKGKTTKKSQEWLKRSRAAKLGWKRRKALANVSAKVQAKRKFVSAVRDVISKSKKNKKKKEVILSIISDATKPKRKSKKDTRIEELERQNEQLKKLLEAEQKLQELYETWVSDVPEDRRSIEDGSFRLVPSKARMHPDAVPMRGAMDLAAQDGKGHLEMIIYQLADQYDLPVRDLWTLYYSP